MRQDRPQGGDFGLIRDKSGHAKQITAPPFQSGGPGFLLVQRLVTDLGEIEDARANIGLVWRETVAFEHCGKCCQAGRVGQIKRVADLARPARPVADGEIQRCVKFMPRYPGGIDVDDGRMDGLGGFGGTGNQRVGVGRLPLRQQTIEQVRAVFEIPVETGPRTVEFLRQAQDFDTVDALRNQGIKCCVDPILAAGTTGAAGLGFFWVMGIVAHLCSLDKTVQDDNNASRGHHRVTRAAWPLRALSGQSRRQKAKRKGNVMKLENIQENVQAYYGDVLQSSADLQTNACCMPDDVPGYLRDVLGKLHDEVLEKYYGCGLIAPLDLTGMHILDLGCGAGRDVYALSALVGETGRVVGVDMTEAQLDVARAHQEYHAKAFGYDRSNVEFHHGYIEKLDQLDLEPGSFDIIVSNCVLNLATDKGAVLRGAHHLLRHGGEMYFSDVYADRRIPEALAKDEVLYGECLSGALYWNDFLNLAKGAGFGDPRSVTRRMLTIENPELEAKVTPLKFLSATYRLFKLDGLEPACEDYGQTVIYRGSVAHSAREFTLDEGHKIEAGKRFEVCGNTFRMLKESRFSRHFEFEGDFAVHNGILAGCGGSSPFNGLSADGAQVGSCCG